MSVVDTLLALVGIWSVAAGAERAAVAAVDRAVWGNVICVTFTSIRHGHTVIRSMLNTLVLRQTMLNTWSGAALTSMIAWSTIFTTGLSGVVLHTLACALIVSEGVLCAASAISSSRSKRTPTLWEYSHVDVSFTVRMAVTDILLTCSLHESLHQVPGVTAHVFISPFASSPAFFALTNS